jgi:hypothetical protein
MSRLFSQPVKVAFPRHGINSKIEKSEKKEGNRCQFTLSSLKSTGTNIPATALQRSRLLSVIVRAAARTRAQTVLLTEILAAEKREMGSGIHPFWAANVSLEWQSACTVVAPSLDL